MSRPVASSHAAHSFRLFRNALIGLALVSVAVTFGSGAAQAQYSSQTTNRYGEPAAATSTPGKFDFYLLVLSWSPTFCEAARERNANRRPDPQCSGRPYAFVVHGLWPQYNRGFPENCQQPSPRVPRRMVDEMLDIMPSPRLVYHEWDRHGTCSGLNASGYFSAIRAARKNITVPAAYVESNVVRHVSAAQVTDEFVAANPGLNKSSIAVTCDDKRLTGIRICMNKDFTFRECDEVARRACRRDNLVMPAMRMNHAADAR